MLIILPFECTLVQTNVSHRRRVIKSTSARYTSLSDKWAIIAFTTITHFAIRRGLTLLFLVKPRNNLLHVEHRTITDFYNILIKDFIKRAIYRETLAQYGKSFRSILVLIYRFNGD